MLSLRNKKANNLLCKVPSTVKLTNKFSKRIRSNWLKVQKNNILDHVSLYNTCWTTEPIGEIHLLTGDIASHYLIWLLLFSRFVYMLLFSLLVLTDCDPMACTMISSSVLQYLLEFAQISIHWVNDAIQPFHPLLPSSPPAFNLSQHQGLFQWVGSLHKVAKTWSFSFSISPSNEYSGLISFRIHWFDLLAVHGDFKSLLRHYSS